MQKNNGQWHSRKFKSYMSQLTDLRRVLYKRFNWQALLSLKTLQGASLVAGVAADNIFGDLFDQWNRQNLSPMFSRVKLQKCSRRRVSGIRWPAIGCTTEKNNSQSNCIYAELQTNNLIFRPLLATMISLLFYVWLCRCHRQVTTSLLSYLQLQLVLTVLHNRTNKREILMSIAMSRKKIGKILSSLVHLQAMKTQYISKLLSY